MTIRHHQPVDPERPWAGRQGGPTDPGSVERGSKFILGELTKYGVIPKLVLAGRFARFGQRQTWEAALGALIQGNHIHLVIDVPNRQVLVVHGPGPDLVSLDILNSPGGNQP